MLPSMPRSLPESDRKNDQIRIRITTADKRRLVRAAERAGLGLSAWLLRLGVRAAARGER